MTMTDAQIEIEHEPSDKCFRWDCKHTFDVHRDGQACRVTRCPCEQFAVKARKTQPVQSRRVCVDVPDGYTLSFSLIPWTSELAPDDLPADDEPETEA